MLLEYLPKEKVVAVDTSDLPKKRDKILNFADRGFQGNGLEVCSDCSAECRIPAGYDIDVYKSVKVRSTSVKAELQYTFGDAGYESVRV